MPFVTPQFSRQEVNTAGDALVDLPSSVEKIDHALEVINNWRSSHSYPLLIVRMSLLNKARRIYDKAVIAQRLKRLTSIGAKLVRFENMQLSRMNDIGGCRAVMGAVAQVNRLVRLYEVSRAKNPHRGPQFIRKYDYITHPKADGYRSVHLVYRYRSTSREQEAYNGLRIEIQLRSQPQHDWATAVEIASTFTGQALKSNVGDEPWKRFFALMGSAMAAREKRPAVPGTPTNETELVRELRELYVQLQLETVLSGWGETVESLPEETIGAAATLLLQLDSKAKTIQVISFRRDELLKGSDEYLRAEKRARTRPELQVVLVSVDSLKALRRAYPNYFLDTSRFIQAVRQVIEK